MRCYIDVTYSILMSNSEIITLSLKDLLNKVSATTDAELSICKTCYLKDTYGSTERKLLRVRKLLTELLQQDMGAVVALESADGITLLTECEYLAQDVYVRKNPRRQSEYLLKSETTPQQRRGMVKAVVLSGDG